MSEGFEIRPMPQRPQAELVARLAAVPVANLSDSMHRIFGGGAEVRPYHADSVLAGIALTVRVPAGDNLLVHKAIDIAMPGDVIVVDAGGALTNAIIGELMVRHAMQRGVAGFVIDGAIRDSGFIGAGRFPVYARGVTHRGPYKNGPGEINTTVRIGDMVVAAGDIVIGDRDGLVTIAAGSVETVLALAVDIQRVESIAQQQIARGTWPREWVDEALRAKGMGGLPDAH